MNITAAKSTVSDLESRLHAAMQAKLDKVLPEPYCKTCYHPRSGHGESGVVCFVDGCPCGSLYKPSYTEPPINKHVTRHDNLGGATVGEGCILEVASDTVAVKACMAAWIERLMREEGLRWEKPYFTVMIEAKEIAFMEILKGKP